ncbi:hypothetical protein KSP40_PGU003594 [Platanthera guangdongensis]|uniref:Uncharacterized protein n=1 Tax=Platanthera guangdongensis TaxID=2320717 RepID=A0ABR2LPD1_9ASPA
MLMLGNSWWFFLLDPGIDTVVVVRSQLHFLCANAEYLKFLLTNNNGPQKIANLLGMLPLERAINLGLFHAVFPWDS